MRAVIIANGTPPTTTELRHWLRPGDLLVCADGGARVALALGLHPHIVIGDFDSLSQPELDTLARDGTQLQRHPPEKDETDLELALLWTAHALAAWPAPHDVIVLGASGGRSDQMLANFMLLALPALRSLNVTIASGHERITLIQPGRPHIVTSAPGHTLSLLPLGGDALGVRSTGLKYALNGERLVFGPARGVSNVLIADHAIITLEAGALLCIYSAHSVGN